MQFVAISRAQWEATFPHAPYYFPGAPFSLLNEDKAEEVLMLAAQCSRGFVGIIAGKRRGALHAPFSAPFSSFLFSFSPLPEDIYDAALALAHFASDLAIPFHITLPPEIYAAAFPAPSVGALCQAGFSLSHADLSYHLPLPLPADFPAALNQKTRKAFRIASSLPLHFEYAQAAPGSDTLRRAYAVIATNREERGFPLHMTLPAVEATSAIIPVDAFVVSTPEQSDVAAAIVYRLSADIAQVVYWGHNYAAPSAPYIHALALSLARHYAPRGFTILDIGPASDRGPLQPGLARFKQQIGCIPSSKLSLSFFP